MSLPRSSRMSSSLAFSRSRPSKTISLSMRAFVKRVSPITVRLDTLLPEPHSPTMPSALPLSTLYEMPSTAFTTPSGVSNCTRRSLTSSSGVEAAGSGIFHPRVEERVRDVDDQVEQDDEEGGEQDRALDLRQVEPLDRVIAVAADAGDVEHRLGEDRAAEQDAEVEAQDRDDGSDGAAHAVPHHHGALAEALRASRADVVLGHGVDQVPAQESRVDRGERSGQHDPGQDQRGEPLGRVLG